MVGLNYNLRCESTTDIAINDFFSLTPGIKTLFSLLDQSGRTLSTYKK